ncbi:uncharacterized protein PAC_03008 [Phialocephala subalpina]|uniref:Uncharacterized protein n=1 Tax=Phialocephala subalpina TaxID=576137 RepID=A0A1L7WK59_9HELO|nr:uncharacterized protein PAC_03008 [Phialocephala subalpina]
MSQQSTETYFSTLEYDDVPELMVYEMESPQIGQDNATSQRSNSSVDMPAIFEQIHELLNESIMKCTLTFDTFEITVVRT